MKFLIRMGVPEMETFWQEITERAQKNSLSGDEKKFFKKFVKALDYLRSNPKHNSLNTHEIDALSKKYGIGIFQSYLENKTPGAGPDILVLRTRKGRDYYFRS